MISSFDWKDIGTRAGWTFAQTFLVFVIPALVAAGNAKTPDFTAVGATVVSGLLAASAAALSVIKTAIAQRLAARKARRQDL